MSITHLDSVSQLSTILSKSKDKYSVIDFHATWCGPCHAIAPTFESLSKQFGKSMNFLKCDVDVAKDVASQYAVSAMPTFIFLKGDTKVHQIRGADRRGLEEAVRKYASSSGSGTGAFTGKGQTLGGAQVSPTVKEEFQAKANDVTAKVSNLDPQVKVLLGLLGGYLIFWYLSSS